MDNLDTIIWLVKAVIIGLVFLSVFLFVLCPLLRSQSLASYGGILPDTTGFGRPEGEELETPTTKIDEPSHQQIVKMARTDPKKTAMLVRNWLYEKK
jgi:flagellar biosynthesis/type III secretory pathway M-ring protein FliF/YscJ